MAAIIVDDISKKFKVYFDKGSSLKEKLLFKNRSYYEDRWVLKGVSFEVKKGEAIGIIGHNGCGKSTLLKLMTRIMYPDKGNIQIEGRVSSLIELGAGFHPDMSGRENIYTNASIFGLKRKEIDARIQDIIDFSGLEGSIDAPVRTYSSGMYMRLAFSVAIHVDADVLLVDEILAVGDMKFQVKCFDKMREIKANGTTIAIVSHSLDQIEQICDRSIWIHNGKVEAEGLPYDVHPAYMEFMGGKSLGSVTNRWGNKDIEILSVQMFSKDGKESSVFKTGDPIRIAIQYITHKNTDNPVVGIGIFRSDGVDCYGVNTLLDKIPLSALGEKGRVIINIEKNNLLEGEYILDSAIHAEDGFSYDSIKGVLRFRMYSDIRDQGVARLDHSWTFEK